MNISTPFLIFYIIGFIFLYFFLVLLVYHIKYRVKRNKIFKINAVDKYKMDYLISLYLSQRK